MKVIALGICCAFIVSCTYGLVIKLLKILLPGVLTNSAMYGIIIGLIGFILTVGGFLFPSYLMEKRRASELKRVATHMGFDFHSGNFYPEPSILKSPLLSRGYRHSFGPAITGKHEGIEILLFEHVYNEPEETSDTGDTRYFRTVTVFHSPDFSIPEFIMVKKGIGDRVFEKVFGSESIYFEDDLNFSNIYSLTGPDQNSVRKFFTPELRSAFANLKKKWASGGINNRLILMVDDESDEQLKPDNFVDYVEETLRIFEIATNKK